MNIKTLAFVVSGAVLISAHYSSAAPYAFVPINMTPAAINNVGQVIGMGSSIPRYTGTYLWEGGNLTEMGYRGAGGGIPHDINDQGWGIGIGDGIVTSSAVWNLSTRTIIRHHVGASQINNAGQLAGVGEVNGQLHMTLRTISADGTLSNVTDLGGGLGGALFFEAEGLNNSGSVVGNSYTTAGELRGVLWDGTTTTVLRPLSGQTVSQAAGINDAGVIVGDSNSRATRWDSTGSPVALESLGGGESFASSINNKGIAVGKSRAAGDGLFRATLWDDTGIVDVNSFLDASAIQDGWSLESAIDINDNGWIIGFAFNSLANYRTGFVLAPVPEPAHYVLLLVGMAIVFGAHRKTATTLRTRVHHIT